MDLLEINQQSCNKDGICAEVCPAGLINFQNGKFPAPVPEVEEICITCGHCVAVCPTGSLSSRDMPLEKCPPIQKEFLRIYKQEINIRAACL